MPLACPSLIAAHFPDLCRAVDIYCERTSPAVDAEPVNAITNAAFLIASWCAWRLQGKHSGPSTPGLVRALIVLIAIVGLGSFLFHTVATRWAEWGDVVPILLFMLLWLWLALICFFGWPPARTLAALSLFFAATFALEAFVPSDVLQGGALYVPALSVLVGIGFALRRRRHPAAPGTLAATGVFLLSFASRTLDAPLCPIIPLGTHFLWHILNALLLYLLARVLILYGSAQRRAES